MNWSLLLVGEGQCLVQIGQGILWFFEVEQEVVDLCGGYVFFFMVILLCEKFLCFDKLYQCFIVDGLFLVKMFQIGVDVCYLCGILFIGIDGKGLFIMFFSSGKIFEVVVGQCFYFQVVGLQYVIFSLFGLLVVLLCVVQYVIQLVVVIISKIELGMVYLN